MRNPINLAGNAHDFAHLNSFTVTIPPKDAALLPAKIVVTFSHHVFTTQWDHAVHTIEESIIEDGEQRAFCKIRHAWSKELPDFIRYHVAGKAYQSKDGKGNLNYFFYEDRNGRSPPYAIYFRLTAASKIAGVDGILHVISAYENPKLLPRSKLQAAKFGLHVSRLIGFKKAEIE